MGALINDANVLARYTGYYKAVQSAGGAISWRIDAVETFYIAPILRTKNINYDSKNSEEKVVLTATKSLEVSLKWM
ncbi:13562_t:CDS:2, partial [Racocetra persica]